MTVSPAAFYLLTAVVLAGGVAVVVLRSLTQAAYALSVTLAAVGLLFVACGAELVGAVEVVFGAFGVCLLLLGGLTLTRSRGPQPATSTALWQPALLVALATTVGLWLTFYASRGDWHTADWPQRLVDNGTTETLARSLLTQAVLPFGVVGVLVGIAVLAATTLGGVDEQERELARAEQLRQEREERARRRREARLRARGRAPAPGDAEEVGA